MIEYRKKNAGDQKISFALGIGIDVDDPFQQALLSNEPIYDKMIDHRRILETARRGGAQLSCQDGEDEGENRSPEVS